MLLGKRGQKMDIYKEILDILKQEYESGATYQEIAKKHNISYQYTRALMQGERPAERISLECLFKLFPQATINLHGDSVIAKNSGINNGLIGVNHGTMHSAPVEDFRSRAILATIDLDLPPEAIHTVQKMLKELK